MTALFAHNAPDRSAATWTAQLQSWTSLEWAVTDGGKGLAKALGDLAQKRSGDPQRPALEQGLDLFHTVYQAHKLLRPLWRGAEAAWKKAEEADEELARTRRQGENALGATKRAQSAWTRAEKALALADQTQRSWALARSAFEVFDKQGNLNTRSRAEAILREAVAGLPGVASWKRVHNALLDRRALVFLDRLHEKLAAIEPRAEWRAAWAWRWWLGQAGQCGGTGVGSVVRSVGREGLLTESEAETFGRVAAVLGRVCRASSAVECLNSVLRLHQSRHRRMTQGMLDLKRLFWNCQASATGRRRGTSPYERLGLGLPTTDFWKLLQSSPAELMERLSTPKVTP